MRLFLIASHAHAVPPSLGVPAQVIARPAASLVSEEDFAPVDHRARRNIADTPLSPSQVAQWIGQRRALITLALEGPQAACILDQDAQILPAFHEHWSGIVETFKGGGADLLLLHAHQPDPRAWGALGPVPGYVITRRAALRFLVATSRLVYPFHGALARPWATGVVARVPPVPLVAWACAPESGPPVAPYPSRPVRRAIVARGEALRAALWCWKNLPSSQTPLDTLS